MALSLRASACATAFVKTTTRCAARPIATISRPGRLVSVRAMASKQVISTDKAPAALGPYSQAIQAGNTVYVSGQIGIVPGT